MGLVARPPKAAGTSQYQTEFAAGAVGIQDTEVDADFETLYRLVNGNLDTSNLSSAAAIGYSQLSLTGRIMNSDIAAAAAIDGHKLAAGTIPASALVPGFSLPAGSIPPNSVGLAQLALGATLAYSYGTGGANVSSVGNGQEVVVLAVPFTNNRGGASHGFGFGIVAGRLFSGSASSQLDVHFRLGGTATDLNGPILAGNFVQADTQGGAVGDVPVCMMVLVDLGGQAVGTQQLKICAAVTGPSNAVFVVLSYQIVLFQFA